MAKKAWKWWLALSIAVLAMVWFVVVKVDIWQAERRAVQQQDASPPAATTPAE